MIGGATQWDKLKWEVLLRYYSGEVTYKYIISNMYCILNFIVG